jgi:hypothetical protein
MLTRAFLAAGALLVACSERKSTLTSALGVTCAPILRR